jgi:hypothetical protein
LSKKHRNWANNQHRSEGNGPPANHSGSEASVIYNIRIQKNPEDEKRDIEEQDYRNKQLNYAKWLNWISAGGAIIAFLALIGLGVNAIIIKLQWDAMRESNRINQTANEIAYRPYVGVNAIILDLFPKPPKTANNFVFAPEIKNFGPVPAINYTADWKVFLDGHEIHGNKIPDNPMTIFPGQSTYLNGQIGTENYKSVMSEEKQLVIELTVEYDGPKGHYKECEKHQFVAHANHFANLGACNTTSNVPRS